MMNKTILILDGKEYQINIEKAKELGVIKEKDSKCRSWEEFKLKYKGNRGYYYDSTTNEIHNPINPWAVSEQLTQQEAIAIDAFSKLLKLRRDWIGNWNPDWNNSENKYCIININNHLTIYTCYSEHHTFSFPTEEMVNEFLGCFRDLFTQCKNLI